MSQGLGFARQRVILEIIKKNWNTDTPEDVKLSINDVLFIIQEMIEYETKAKVDNKFDKYEVFKLFVKHILHRNLANFDSMLLLTSDKGTGKSSAALLLAREWCKLIGIRFDPKRHFAYSNKDVMDKVDSLNKFEPLVCDEAVRFASSADWAKSESKELRRKLAEVRTKHLFFILAFPLKIYKMEKNYLECLDGDTLIKTEFGDIKIKDLEGKQNFKVYTLNEKLNTLELKNAKSCIKTKTDYVYEIITQSNTKILATKNHRFMTYNGWKHLHEIKINDEIKLNDLSYTKILSIECKDKKNVYDILDVEDNHNYIANNFVVHNSFVNYWCVTGDTKIKTRDINGMIRNTPVKKLNKYNPEVLSFNEKTKEYEFKKYEKKIKTKKNAEIYELELENGLKIKCTEDHPFLTQRGWIRLKDLSEDDKVEVKTKKCNWCKKDFLPKKQQQIYCSEKCKNAFNVRTERQYNYNKKYREINREDNKHRCRKRYYEKYNEILKKLKKNYYNNREDILKKHSEYRKKNREKIRNHEKKSLLNINYKISKVIRSRLNTELRKNKTKKTQSIFKYLGCSIEYFKIHISKQFKPGMSWVNWGKDTWNLDHIIPCSHFDLTKEDERYKCFNYKNLQPLWAQDNLSKGDRYVG